MAETAEPVADDATLLIPAFRGEAILSDRADIGCRFAIVEGYASLTGGRDAA